MSTAPKLRAAIDLSMLTRSDRLRIDGSQLALVTSSGIEVFLHALDVCRETGSSFELVLSRSARRVLDLVGLWWLGTVDDGRSLDVASREARRAYADLGWVS